MLEMLVEGSISASKWHKLSELIVCFYVVRSLEKDNFLKNLHILSCFVQLKSVLFNLLRVLDLFSERRQSTLFKIFFGFELEQVLTPTN